MIYGHGDDIYAHGDVRINFSSNVYRAPNLDVLKAHLCAQIDKISVYPEPDAHSLKEMIAQQSGRTLANIWVTNGATEAIYLIAQAFAGKSAVILSPVFREYQDACAIHNIQVTHIFSIDEYQGTHDLFWLCNPCNPTGDYLDPDVLTALFRRFPDTLFIVDASYEHFIRTTSPAMSTISEPNVLWLQSMTKCYAIPGLRLGYMTASPALIEKIAAYAMPWSVNQLAIEAGKFLLMHSKEFAIDLPALHAETHALQTALQTIPFLEILPTQTHFFLVRLHEQSGLSAAMLKEHLIRTEGILIREASNFTGLGIEYFRIATQTHEENQYLIQVLKTCWA